MEIMCGEHSVTTGSDGDGDVILEVFDGSTNLCVAFPAIVAARIAQDILNACEDVLSESAPTPREGG